MTLNDYSKRDMIANKNFNELLELLNEDELFFFNHNLCEQRHRIPLIVVSKKSMLRAFKYQLRDDCFYLDEEDQKIVKSIISKVEEHLKPNINKDQLQFDYDPTATKAY